MLNKLTIFIPVYNRFSEAYRLFNYYTEKAVGTKLVILDNSNKRNTLFENLVVNNADYEYYPTITSYATKLANGIKKYGNTDYSVICAQDDFISIDALKKCINFLDSQKNYVVCRGQTLPFFKQNGNLLFANKTNYVSLDNDDPLDRIQSHFSNYSSTFYSLHRTEVLKEIWEISSLNTDDLRFGELLPSVLSIYLGKLKTYDFIYILRELDINSDGHTTPTIVDFIKEGSFKRKYNRFEKGLSQYITDKKIIKKGFNQYLKNNYNGNVKNIWLKTKLKTFIGYKNKPKIFNYISQQTKQLIQDPNYQDIKDITILINNFKNDKF